MPDLEISDLRAKCDRKTEDCGRRLSKHDQAYDRVSLDLAKDFTIGRSKCLGRAV